MSDRDETVAKLVKLAEAQSVDVEELASLVHDLAMDHVANVNNGGMRSQMAYILDYLGYEGAKGQIGLIVEGRDGEDTRDAETD